MQAVIAEADQLVDDRGRRLSYDEPVSAIAWRGDEAWIGLGSGSIVVETPADHRSMFAVHDGAILCAAPHPDGSGVLTGGDDGRLVLTRPDGTNSEFGNFGSLWVEHLAASKESGIVVASAGRQAVVWPRGSHQAAHRFTYPSTVSGIALDAKGKRLAAAHYCGVTLNYALAADGTPKPFFWAGSHLSCTFSPDSRFLISSLQETGLHGWVIATGHDMRMSGYRAKTRSFSWSMKGKWLASSGDDAAIVWPFSGKDGPMGSGPVFMGPGGSIVTQVAFHPYDDVLAIGYADGAVVIARMGERGYIPIQQAGSQAIAALSWNARGNCLGWGGEDGLGGIVDVERAR
jgi:WD40 repeat protein